jgi:hypothetical protein
LEFKKIMENVFFISETLKDKKVEVKNPSVSRIKEKAYNFYWKCDCECGVVTAFYEEANLSIDFRKVRVLSGELPYRWSSICGAVTGAFYVLAASLPEELLEKAVKEIINYHNRTPLPQFKGRGNTPIPKAPAGSILCRDSIINWCKAAKVNPRSRERTERCARITADIAGKTAELLKKYAVATVK